MHELNNKQFNEVFLTQWSRFDVRKYAYDIFFNCNEKRFHKISRHWGRNYGWNSQNYMASNFYNWKSNYVSPNSSSRYKIIDSTLNTLNKEEKFVDAYNSIAIYISKKYPSKIRLSQIKETITSLSTTIDSFNLENESRNAKMIYNNDDIHIFESTVKGIFKVYMNLIFNKLEEDVLLIKSLIQRTNTEFLEIGFKLYLFGIQIEKESLATENYKSPLKSQPTANFNSIWHNELSDLSLSKVAEIKKANDVTKIDAFLSNQEIDKFINNKHKIVKSKNGGEIKLNLKSHSGIIDIKLRVLSEIEKLIIFSRIILAMTIVGVLLSILISTGKYIGYIILGMFLNYAIILPDKEDYVKLFKDFKNKYFGK